MTAARDMSELQRVEDALRAALHEKEVLLKEVHHRVKNNLQIVSSLLRLQARCTVDNAVRAALLESVVRVDAMAMVHQKIYESHDLARVDFSQYAHELLDHLRREHGRPGIMLTESLGNMHLPADAAIPCGLIIGELVTNALKHAFPSGTTGVVDVLIAEQGSHTQIVQVRDDGIGLPEDPARRTLGLELVTTLTRQLKAKLHIERTRGTTFRIELDGRGQ